MRCTTALVILLAGSLQAQDNKAGVSPARAHAMLREVRQAIERHYFDPTFGGRALDDLFKVAEQRLAIARSTSDVVSALALPLMDLEDSHTRFIPPPRATVVQYGIDFAAVGDRVLVVTVVSGSDAEAQGIRVGDELLQLNRLEAHEFQLEIDALRDFLAIRHRAIGEQILLCRMPAFTGDTDAIDDAVRRARNFKTLIFDLRGNGGGAVVGLERLASHFFAKPVVLAKIVYGVSVTIANVVMSDGSRLERVGVIPDLLLVPTPEDLRLGRDAVLANAVARAGGSMTPEEAAALFPAKGKSQ